MNKVAPRLLVVIVNFRTADLVCRNLNALIPQLDLESDSVKIVDNNSADDSIEVLEKFIEQQQYGSNVELIKSTRNGGFSYGNNLAIREALAGPSRPEFVLLLNPDTLVLDDAIDELIRFMHVNPKVGIAGSRLEGEDGQAQCSAFRFHSFWSELESAFRLGLVSRWLSHKKVSTAIPVNATITDWVAGASMLIRTDVFDATGLMDEQYFLYFEETDFCLQAKRSGWTCWYVPTSRVIHFVGQSTGIVSGDKQNRPRPKYWFEARQYFFKKNYGFLYTLITDLVWGISFALWRLRRKIQNKPDDDPKGMLLDFWKNSSWFSFLNK